MFRALIFFIIAAVVIWGVYLLSGITAPVTLTWGDRIFGPYAPFEAAVAATVVVVLALVVWNILAWLLWRKPKDLYQKMGLRRREEGYKALIKGMVAVATGDSREAARQSLRAEARLSEDQPLARMLAAAIAKKNGDEAGATEQFEAMTEQEETKFLGLQGLFEQAREAGDLRRAVTLLEQANEAKPDTPWVLENLFRLQAMSSRWEGARDTLDRLKKKKLVEKDKERHWRAVIDVEASRERAEAKDGDKGLSYAREAYKSHPEFVPAAVQYADMESSFGRNGRAEKAIHDAWIRIPHPDLVSVYERVISVYDPTKQYEMFKKLGEKNPNHIETRIMLAREAIRAGAYDDARTHLLPLTERGPDARVCRLMADLELASGGDRMAARDWMARASNAAPDPVWVCSESGDVVVKWSAISPSGGFDTLEWRRPNYVPVGLLSNPVDAEALLEDHHEDRDPELVDAELLPPPVVRGEHQDEPVGEEDLKPATDKATEALKATATP